MKLLELTSFLNTIYRLVCKKTPDVLTFLQLLCFYFVFTTFTTVGYGTLSAHNFVADILKSMTEMCCAGDIYALTDGERVSAQTVILIKIILQLLVAQHTVCPKVASVFNMYFAFLDKVFRPEDLFGMTGILYLPISGSSVPLWHADFTDQRHCSEPSGLVQGTR